MKKLCSLLLAVLLLCGLLGAVPVAAASGSLSAKISAETVTVGNKVTLTLTYNGGGASIASIDARISYNADAFQYLSASGASVSGGSGVIKLSYYANDTTPPGKVTISLTFKAVSPGKSNFAVETNEFTNDKDYSSLGTPDKTVSAAAINPTLSGNANLSSLRPSRGTLTPKFNSKTTNYTIWVPYTTTSLSLSATTQDKGAKTSVSGKNSLSVGKNTQVITVTAPNGTTKKYTVVITRDDKQDTTAPSGSAGSTTTTTAAPPKDALEVTVNGELMNVADTQPQVQLPAGFEWSYIPLNGVQVSAAKNEKSGMTLLYLTKASDEKVSAFYIYDAASGEFAAFRPFTISGADFVLLDMPAQQEAPTGTIVGTFSYKDSTIEAFTYTDELYKDYTIVYAVSPTGTAGLYVYDQVDGTMQRYHAPVAPADVDLDKPAEKKTNAVITFFTDYRNVLLISAAILCGLALLVGAVVMAVRLMPHSERGKH